MQLNIGNISIISSKGERKRTTVCVFCLAEVVSMTFCVDSTYSILFESHRKNKAIYVLLIGGVTARCGMYCAVYMVRYIPCGMYGAVCTVRYVWCGMYRAVFTVRTSSSKNTVG